MESSTTNDNLLNNSENVETNSPINNEINNISSVDKSTTVDEKDELSKSISDFLSSIPNPIILPSKNAKLRKYLYREESENDPLTMKDFNKIKNESEARHQQYIKNVLNLDGSLKGYKYINDRLEYRIKKQLIADGVFNDIERKNNYLKGIGYPAILKQQLLNHLDYLHFAVSV